MRVCRWLLPALVLGLAACVETGNPVVYYTAEYRVEGTVSSANIIWQSGQYFNSTLPWSYSTEHAQSGDSFYLAAQSNSPTGSLTVSALVDGSVIATETTSAAFGFVAISGSIP